MSAFRTDAGVPAIILPDRESGKGRRVLQNQPPPCDQPVSGPLWRIEIRYLQDPALTDAMWIDESGFLWIPCGQINRLGAFQKGKNTVNLPVIIYKMKIDAKPLLS